MAAAGAEPAVEFGRSPCELGGGECSCGVGGERERCGLACAALVVHALDVYGCRGVASVGQEQAAFGVAGAGREHCQGVDVGCAGEGSRVLHWDDRAVWGAQVGNGVEFEGRADGDALAGGWDAEAFRQAIGGVAELEVGGGEGGGGVGVYVQREGIPWRAVGRHVKGCDAGAWRVVDDAEEGFRARRRCGQPRVRRHRRALRRVGGQDALPPKNLPLKDFPRRTSPRKYLFPTYLPPKDFPLEDFLPRNFLPKDLPPEALRKRACVGVGGGAGALGGGQVGQRSGGVGREGEGLHGCWRLDGESPIAGGGAECARHASSRFHVECRQRARGSGRHRESDLGGAACVVSGEDGRFRRFDARVGQAEDARRIRLRAREQGNGAAAVG